jgi:FkbM family methyltransferase
MVNESDVLNFDTLEGSIAYYKNDAFIIKETKTTNKIYERDLVHTFLYDILIKASVVIDGGAHAGSHTVLYKNINPKLEIYAFEPQQKMFDLLKHNVNKNNLKKVNLFNLALANQVADVNMATTVYDGPHIFENLSYGEGENFNLGGLGLGIGGEQVKAITIDTLNLQKCDFIKLDLEGSEYIALLGAIKTISKHRPTILFEHNHHQLSADLYAYFNVVQETPFDLLKKWGYSVIPIGLGNYLATPQENKEGVFLMHNVPKTVIQTGKVKPEQYVIDQILRLCPGWNYKYFSDEDIIKFFIANPLPNFSNIISKFNSFKVGAHKADLFRYYYLYLNGGVYIDTDLMIEKDIDFIIDGYDFVSLNSCAPSGTISNSFIATTAKNKIIRKALTYAYQVQQEELDKNYHHLCKNLYEIVNLKNNKFESVKLYNERFDEGIGAFTLHDKDGTRVMCHYSIFKVIPKEPYIFNENLKDIK